MGRSRLCAVGFFWPWPASSQLQRHPMPARPLGPPPTCRSGGPAAEFRKFLRAPARVRGSLRARGETLE